MRLRFSGHGLTVAIALAAGNVPAYAASSTFTLPGPGGSRFGEGATVLPNGNFVVSDPGYDTAAANDVGAVTLHRPDGSVISRLAGTRAGDKVGLFGVTALPSGDVVAQSPIWNGRRGAATWIDGERGLDGEVSELNSLVGDGPNAETGWFVLPLANGHYVVSSPSRRNAAGAVTWCDGTAGCRGRVSEDNSLVGATAGDYVAMVKPLPNGNYVVVASNWDRGAVIDAGAITLGDGSRGTAGRVSIANSLVGTTPRDQIGFPGGVTVLADGDFVVSSWYWDDAGGVADVGAITRISGVTGLAGSVSAENSLVGSAPQDRIGTQLRALAHGGFVATSWDVDGRRGAVTWCGEASACRGTLAENVTARGLAPGDFSDSYPVALANGHLALQMPFWDAPGGKTDVGAVTWIDGRVGRAAPIDGSNALTGTHVDDAVGTVVTALADGSYVVGSPQWDADIPHNAGAATWRAGDDAATAVVSAANSLVGKSPNDEVGRWIMPMRGADYVVISSRWDDPDTRHRDVGAITYCADGASCSGLGALPSPSRANSLTGKSSGDLLYAGLEPLQGTDFVVTNAGYDVGTLHDAGAVTWWRGGSPGAIIGPENSLLGSHAEDRLGNGHGIRAHGDGSYSIEAVAYDEARGAVIFGERDGPLRGEVDAGNSVVGTEPRVSSFAQAYDPERRQLVLGHGDSNRVVLFRPGIKTTTELTVVANAPGAPPGRVTFGVTVLAESDAPFGRTRVYGPDGAACESLDQQVVPRPDGGHATFRRCAIDFAGDGSREIRAEYFGNDRHGYSSSAALAIDPGAEALHADGFE